MDGDGEIITVLYYTRECIVKVFLPWIILV